jgi:hypothetical protein
LSHFRFESPPDVTSTALGPAGSRRTVYLGEENKSEVEPPSSTTTTTATSNGNAAETSPETAPVFLMYNKISTTVEAPASGASANDTNGNENQKSKGDKKKGDPKNRESAIW